MYYYGYNSGYSYGSPCYQGVYQYPAYGNNGLGNGTAIILVLFILLVIVIGSRFLSNN